MFLHVSEAKYLYDYVIWLKFNDGVKGEIDLRNELRGEVFAPFARPGRIPAIPR